MNIFEQFFELLPGIIVGFLPAVAVIIPSIKSIMDSVKQKKTVTDLMKDVRDLTHLIEDLDKVIKDNEEFTNDNKESIETVLNEHNEMIKAMVENAVASTTANVEDFAKLVDDITQKYISELKDVRNETKHATDNIIRMVDQNVDPL